MGKSSAPSQLDIRLSRYNRVYEPGETVSGQVCALSLRMHATCVHACMLHACMLALQRACAVQLRLPFQDAALQRGQRLALHL